MPDEPSNDIPPVPIPGTDPGNASGTPVEADPASLTKEEQLARYEQFLKENDWGHQPC